MSMEDVFKFVSLRPPRTPSRTFSVQVLIKAEADTPLVEQLRKAPDARRASALAKAFMSSADYLPDVHTLIGAVTDAAGAGTVKAAKEQLAKVLGASVVDYLASAATKTLSSRLWDSFYAQVVEPDERAVDREPIYGGLRSLHYLKRLATLADEAAPPEVSEFLGAKPVIDKTVFALDGKGAGRDDALTRQKQATLAAFRELCAKVRAMQAASIELKSLARSFRAEEQRTLQVEGGRVSQLGDRLLQGFQPMLLTGPLLQKQQGWALSAAAKGDKAVASKASVTSVVTPARKPWVFEAYGQKNLSKQTQAVLAANALEFAELEDVEIAAALKAKMTATAKDFFARTPKVMLGYVSTLEEFRWLTELLPLPGIFLWPSPPAAPVEETAETRGIKPLGIGDLLVVRQELLRYTAGEVAHIENVLKSEEKARIHRRIRESEEQVVIETEQLEETERDLQTTERFELQKETQKTIESEMQIQAGLSVTASYGAVSATASGEFSFSTSTSESMKTASSFAKEVIDRSVSRILRRAREERTRRTLERFEEENRHGFDNKTGDGHVIGIYRWVDKHYRARVINYGRRLMFEFVVPEPAAFYLHTQAGRPLEGVTATEPDPPKIWGRDLKPEDLTRENYSDYIAQYGVRDAEPFPEPIVRVSSAMADAPGAGEEKNINLGAVSDKLKVPDGYRAIDVYGSYYHVGYDGDFFDVLVGGESWGSMTAYGVEGVIPVSVAGWVSAYHVNVVAKCELKDETIGKWQLKTFQAIVNAYQNALAEYHEQVAAAQLQRGVAIQGKNPELNRRIEQEELRKGALRLLTNDFKRTGVEGLWLADERFNAMRDGGAYGYPEFDVDEAVKEGRIVQFFEQAFEWQNIVYRLYPYFWGRKQHWNQTHSREDVDPAFTDFLRAGSARVVVPVHPAYNEAILYYLKTNRIWLGGEPPGLDDPLYVSIVEELRAQTELELGDDLPPCSVDSGYPCLADAWDVKVPTTLTYLQEGSELPDVAED